MIDKMVANWKTIETAPLDGTEVLAWDGHAITIVSYRYDDNDYNEEFGKLWLDNSYDDFSYGLAACVYEPTHWMKLPKPPTPTTYSITS